MDRDSRVFERTRLAIFLCLYSVILAYGAVISESIPRYFPQPYHTSVLSGACWIEELMAGHPQRIHNELGMDLEVFVAFVDELKSCGMKTSKFGITVEEQAAMFLHTSVTAQSLVHEAERFQHTGETVSRCAVQHEMEAKLDPIPDIFALSSTSSPVLSFTKNGLHYLLLVILSPLESLTTRNSIHISEMQLVHWMESILHALRLPKITTHLEIARMALLRTAWQAAPLICGSSMWPVGMTGPLLMPRCSMKLVSWTFQSSLGSTG